MNKKYHIINNIYNRRIMVINEIINIDKTSEIKMSDFDSVFIDLPDASKEELVLAMKYASPITGEKCWMKPLFISKHLSKKLLNNKYIFDGTASSINDELMAKSIERILGLVSVYNIKQIKENSHMNLVYFLRIYKYLITRDINEYIVNTNGYMIEKGQNNYVYINPHLFNNTKADFLRFNQHLVELGYVSKKKFLERIHVCPNDLHSHLYFVECCPNCNSSDISEESMIHHFRCANISPESTYIHDGELVCPKCKHVLRHIGVDYDRPATVYHCLECNHTFFEPVMRVTCKKCLSKMSPENLTSFDIYKYELTEKGIANITKDETFIKVSKDIWRGYTTFENFFDHIRLFSQQIYEKNLISVARFKLLNPKIDKYQLMDIMGHLENRYYYNHISFFCNFIFMADKYERKEFEEKQSQLLQESNELIEFISMKYGDKIQLSAPIVYHLRPENNIDTFLQTLISD